MNGEIKDAINDLFTRPSNSSKVFKEYINSLVEQYTNEAMEIAKLNDGNMRPEFRLGAASAMKKLKDEIDS